jgi:uncharacterized membrane protein YvbJ
MINLIKKIQQKPRSTRTLILWLSTILVMIVIIAIWLFSFSRNLRSKKTGTEIETTNLPSLFESLKKDFSSFKQGLEASLKNINLEQDNEGQQ